MDLLKRYLQVEHHFQQGKSRPGPGDSAPRGRAGLDLTPRGLLSPCSPLRQVRDKPAGAAEAGHGAGAALHLLPCAGRQEEPAGDHADCKRDRASHPGPGQLGLRAFSGKGQRRNILDFCRSYGLRPDSSKLPLYPVPPGGDTCCVPGTPGMMGVRHIASLTSVPHL